MNAAIMINAVGVAAGLCSMASFVPQLVKIVRERRASGVSLTMFGVTIAGFGLWIAYGALKSVWLVAASNGVCLLLAAAIFVLRLRYGGD